MIATVNSQVLAEQLRALAKIVPTKPAIAILSHVLLRADDEGINFYATDLEVALGTSCPARVLMPGTCALPMERFLALVERFNDGDVDISLEKGQVVLKCGGFSTKLQALSAADFPPAPVTEGETVVLDAGGLRRLIAKTRYAVAAGGSIQVLKGALLTLSGPVAAMAATDSKRLALVTMMRAGTDHRLIIPAKTLDVLASQSDEGDVEIAIGPRHLFFTQGTRRLVSRTIDGEYPKYERIIPRAHTKVVTIEKLNFAAALRRVALISEDTHAVYFNLEAGALKLTAQNAQVGSADETIRVAYEGEPLQVCINGDYVLDFLEVAGGSTITMSLKGKDDAALFTDGADHIAVLMLMRA